MIRKHRAIASRAGAHSGKDGQRRGSRRRKYRSASGWKLYVRRDGTAPRLDSTRRYARGVSRKLLILDGHSLAYRAFFALPDTLATSSGQVTNAVYGFTSMLIKLMADERPDGVAVCFDKGAPGVPPRALHGVQGQPARDARPLQPAAPADPRTSSTRCGSRSSSSRASRPTTSSRRSPSRPRRRATRSSSCPATATCCSSSATA